MSDITNDVHRWKMSARSAAAGFQSAVERADIAAAQQWLRLCEVDLEELATVLRKIKEAGADPTF